MMNHKTFRVLKRNRAAKLAELSLLAEGAKDLANRLDKVALEFSILDEEVKLNRALFESDMKKPVVFTGIEEVK